MTGLAQKNRDLYRRCDRFLAGEVLSSSTSGFPASKKQAVNKYEHRRQHLNKSLCRTGECRTYRTLHLSGFNVTLTYRVYANEGTNLISNESAELAGTVILVFNFRRSNTSFKSNGLPSYKTGNVTFINK